MHSLSLFVILYILCVFLAIALNLFSQLSRGSIRALEEFDVKTSERLEKWFDHPEEIRVPLRLVFLFSMTVFISLIWCNAPATECQNRLNFTWQQYSISIIVLGIFYFIITESMSHLLSLKSSVKVFNLVMPIIEIIKWILFPITLPLIYLCRRAHNWRQNHTAEEEVITAEDEILSLVEQDDDAEKKSLDEDERRMIKGIFDLDETMVREIMTPRVDLVAIPENASMTDVLTKIKETGVTHIPIYREKVDNITGILYAKDLLSHCLDQPSPELTEIARQAWFIPETKNIGDLLQEIINTGRHIAIVLDEYGGISGIVTIKDILEEIIGEIHDYSQQNSSHPNIEESEIITNPDGSYDIDARINVEELNEKLNIDFKINPNVDTLAGLILNISGRIPLQGEKLSIDNQDLIVIEAEPQKIIKVRLLPKNKESNNALEE